MIIDLNGHQTQFPDEATIADVLEAMGRTDTPCAVERNHELISWRTRGEVRLAQGDTLEVATLVGGG